MIIRFFSEARWQLQQTTSGGHKAINLANPQAQPLYGQEALDAVNRVPRQLKPEPQSTPRVRRDDPPSLPSPGKAIMKPPPAAPAPPKAIAKAPMSGESGKVITPDGVEDKKSSSPSHPIHSFLKHLNSANISREQKIEYGKAVHQVLKNMPDKARQAFADVQWSSAFYATSEHMAHALAAKYPEKREAILSRIAVAKCAYEPRSKRYILNLDGGTERTTTQEVYSHEIGHMVDHFLPDGTRKYSSHPEWTDAWNNEHIGDYARTNAKEGFAEFSRLVWSGQYKMDAIARSYPKSFAYFKKHGLVHGTSSQASRTEPREVFDDYVPLDKHNHIDARKSA